MPFFIKYSDDTFWSYFLSKNPKYLPKKLAKNIDVAQQSHFKHKQSHNYALPTPQTCPILMSELEKERVEEVRQQRKSLMNDVDCIALEKNNERPTSIQATVTFSRID
jgi:hypothetical protein